MEKLSGADMLIRAVQDEGVEYVFGYPAVERTLITTLMGRFHFTIILMNLPSSKSYNKHFSQGWDNP